MPDSRIVSFDLFPSIASDVSGGKRLIHDMLNMQVMDRQSGLRPIRGDQHVHEIDVARTGVHTYLLDASEYGNTTGFILVTVDHDDVGDSGNGKILSTFYWEDPLDRARLVFTGSIQNDAKYFVLPVVTDYQEQANTPSGGNRTYTYQVQLAKFNISDGTATFPLGSYNKSIEFVQLSTSEPFTYTLSPRIYRTTNGNIIVASPTSIDIVSLADGSTTKSITIASQSVGPVNSAIGVDRDGRNGYFTSPSGVLYRFRISGTSTTATSLGSVTANFYPADMTSPAGIRAFRWICNSDTGQMYALCEGYNSGANRINLVKFKKTGSGVIAKDWELDFSTSVNDFVFSLDQPPMMQQLPNGNIFIHLFWSVPLDTDQLRFIEVNHETGAVVNDDTILDDATYSLNYNRGCVSPDGTKMVVIQGSNQVVCFDITDVGNVSVLWNNDTAFYESELS